MSITRSSFYNSFGSREALFEEALALYQRDNIFFEDDETGSAGDTICDFFKAICKRLAHHSEGNGCLIMNCYVQATPEKPAPVGVQAAVDDRHSGFMGLLEKAVEEGRLPADSNCAEIADSLLTFLIGLNMVGRRVHDESALWGLTEPFLKGLGLTCPRQGQPH